MGGGGGSSRRQEPETSTACNHIRGGHSTLEGSGQDAGMSTRSTGPGAARVIPSILCSPGQALMLHRWGPFNPPSTTAR